MAQRAAFITGSTGFLGRRLLAELLRTTDLEFYLLARSPEACDVTLRAKCPCQLNRVHVLHGELASDDLGIAAEDRRHLERTVVEVWHLGALTSFDVADRPVSMQVNVDGTRNVLAFSRRFRNLERFYHMSTAYVAGREAGPIPEGPFPNRAGFKNPYEESKYAGEEIVRTSDVPYAILRPSIIMGDSITGECGAEKRMMYGYVLGLLRAAMHVFDSGREYWDQWYGLNGNLAKYPNVNARLVADYDATKNMVTIDDVVRICLAIRSSAPERRTFNIVNHMNLTCRQIIEEIQRALKVTGYSLKPSLADAKPRRSSMVERAAFRNTRPFWPYTTALDPEWETGHVDSLGVPRIEMNQRLFGNLVSTFVARIAAQ